MIAQYKTRTVLFVGTGVILKIIGGALAKAGILGAMLGWAVGLVGWIAFLFGCAFYAKGKGYPAWVGLLGLLSCIGLVILLVLPDKHSGNHA